MTAQVGDIYEYNGDEFTCLRHSNEGLFCPGDYGFIPRMIITSCCRGYRCKYEITDDKLVLQTLQICDKNGHYPEINGVRIPFSVDAGTWQDNGNLTLEKLGYFVTAQTYEHLDLPIKYTGKLLLAKDFNMEYYYHQGSQRPFGYSVLISLEFDNGVLQNTVDHNETARMLREIYEEEKCRDFFGFGIYEYLPEDVRKTTWWYDLDKQLYLQEDR